MEDWPSVVISRNGWRADRRITIGLATTRVCEILVTALSISFVTVRGTLDKSLPISEVSGSEILITFSVFLSSVGLLTVEMPTAISGEEGSVAVGLNVHYGEIYGDVRVGTIGSIIAPIFC